MLRNITLCLAFGVVAGLGALPAAAQDYDDQDRDHGPPDHNRPPVGADVAYDYLSRDYYRYGGPAPQAPAAREQDGYRDGVTQREPLTAYWSGVRQVWPSYGWRHRCGCYGYYGGRYGYNYGRRRGRGGYYRGGYYEEADRYLGDELDTQDYGRRSYNDSTRRYTDHHFTHDSFVTRW